MAKNNLFLNNLRSFKRSKKDLKLRRDLKKGLPLALLSFNLVQLRFKYKISQTELAKKSGVSLRSILYIEIYNRRNNPTIIKLWKLAKALNVKFLDLFKPVNVTEF